MAHTWALREHWRWDEHTVWIVFCLEFAATLTCRHDRGYINTNISFGFVLNDCASKKSQYVSFSYHAFLMLHVKCTERPDILVLGMSVVTSLPSSFIENMSSLPSCPENCMTGHSGVLITSPFFSVKKMISMHEYTCVFKSLHEIAMYKRNIP